MDTDTVLIPLKQETLAMLVNARERDETLDAAIRRLAEPRMDKTSTGGLRELGTRVFASPLLKRRAVHDILEALLEYPTHKSSRMRIIDRVKEIRRARGERIPLHLEESVQRSFQEFCGEASGFDKGPDMNIFCWPEGKWTGTWGLNVEIVEKYLVRLERRGQGTPLSEFLA